MPKPQKNSRIGWLITMMALPFLGILICAVSGSSGAPPHGQPIPFYHQVHVGLKQIPCAYCHHTAATADFAGMPSTQVCMGCHRAVIPEFTEIWKLRSYWELGQSIPWRRVNQLPGHVYFSHKAHVAADVNCTVCHGQVETMTLVQQTAPLTMGWCVDCHKQKKASVECVSCHR